MLLDLALLANCKKKAYIQSEMWFWSVNSVLFLFSTILVTLALPPFRFINLYVSRNDMLEHMIFHNLLLVSESFF